ncbi:MAG: IPTL-CTERM sorting domain-containing protein [Phycisphaerae bacterium]
MAPGTTIQSAIRTTPGGPLSRRGRAIPPVRWGLRNSRSLCAGLFALATCSVALGSGQQLVLIDPPCDARPTPTDPGADGLFNADLHRQPELLSIRTMAWSPDDPQDNPFIGSFDANGGFVRIDVRLLGLMNPPGSNDPLDFSPFAYGDNPVFGFLEFDMDRDNQTGGELDAPQFRYNSNIVRFGGVPSGSPFENRIALDETAFDGVFDTLPLVDQSGEEFHMALLGEVFSPSNITIIDGNADLIFEAGETWWIQAPWFHRAHGYEPFSVAKGGGVPGRYEPTSLLQFQHDLETDITSITLVFPLTNEAAGSLTGEPPEPLNHDPTDQASLLEAINDLVISALFLDMFPSGMPEEQIIIRWKNKDPLDSLDPSDWDVTALLGTSYDVPESPGPFFLWSDTYPNVMMGDMNGDELIGDLDENLVEAYVLANDAADGVVDGSVTVNGFASGFSVFDINYDGVVDGVDIDLAEYGTISACIPALSEWGMILLMLLLACAGTLIFRQPLRQPG